jgi:hypothetical protein
MRRITLTLVALCAAALTLAPAALAAGPKAHDAGFRGSGRTSQGGRVLLNLSSSGRSIRVTTEYQVSCDSGATYTDTVTVSGPSHPGGFRGHHLSRVKFDFINTDSGTISGIPATLEVETTGNIRLDTGNARGTIQPTLTLGNGDKCTSGNSPITYSASF